MASASRVVLDTNVILSALLAFDSTPGKAARSAMHQGALLASEATIFELDEVLRRPKFRKLVSSDSAKAFLENYRSAVQLVHVKSLIAECRDPRDNKFLEVAVDGNADVIVSGDEDLLSLDPFQGIRIMSPQSFLATFTARPDENEPT